MFTNLMRGWLQQIQRSQLVGKPRRRRQRPSFGGMESLESRTVPVAAIGSVGTATLLANADDSAATARDLGTLTATPITVSDFVGSVDPQDFTRFTITRSSDFRLSLSSMTADADVRLQNAQGQFVASSTRGGAQTEELNCQLSAGTYFVRVYQYSGDTNYDLTLSAVANDNSTATARDLGTLGGATPTTLRDFVGNPDTQDHSRFTIVRPSDVQLRLTGIVADVDVQLFNNQGQVVASSTRRGSQSEEINCTLNAGTYYMRVYQYSGNTWYNLSLSAVVNDPLSSARDLGTIGSTATRVSDSVSNAAPQDYYRFRLNQPGEVGLSTSAWTTTVLQLLDGQGRLIGDSPTAGIPAGEVRRSLLAGTYFARVIPASTSIGSADIPYELIVVVRGSDDSIATARDLGTLGSAPTTVRDFVGLLDTQDHFRFTLTEARNVRVQLTGLSADADVLLLNAQGQVVASAIRYGTTSEDFTRSLAAGTYFIRVVRWSGDTNYDLTLS